MRALKFFIFSLLTLALPALAQQRSARLDIQVSAAPDDNLKGQELTVTFPDYGVGYGYLALDDNGHCSLSVYPGRNIVELQRDGYLPYSQEVDAVDGETTSLQITLQEDIQAPTALTADYHHNVFTGKGDVAVSWNLEPDIFFDDFESYEPFAIQFGDWTGFDLDGDVAARLAGDYPNASTLQYCTIVNPLAVEPTWWYDYPILRPFSGIQYAGFIRTNTGVANNDWLITPTITPGHDNVFEFLARAADVYNEKFQVYITTKVDDPTERDFVLISGQNYETATYKGWRRCLYDISAYEGVPVKFAIRYMSSANNGGAFMLMVDNVRVGSSNVNPYAKSRRIPRSPANPNESFIITLDGVEVGTTDLYNFTIPEVEPGEHTVGVRSKYLNATSAETTTPLSIPVDVYCDLKFNFSHPDQIAAPSGSVTITDSESGEFVQTTFTPEDPQPRFLSVPYGKYSIEVKAEPGYQTLEQEITLSQPQQTFDLALSERFVTPMNAASATDPETGVVTVNWNRNACFSDSFEDYPDFAQNKFGDWLSIDLDQHIVYPISLNNNIIQFPGAALPEVPAAIAPIVFNAAKTTPPMLPTDLAMTAPTGEKQILFFSPQSAGANKWLVSPMLEVMDGYVLRITAKSYTTVYPESLEFGVTTDPEGDPATMQIIAETGKMPGDQWMMYEVDMNQFAGQKVRIGIHYISYDAFFAQMDDFYLGNGQAAGEDVDAGNVLEYELWLDNKLHSTTTATEARFEGLEPGTHTIGIVALYATGRSEMATLEVNVGSSGIITLQSPETPRYYRLDGLEISAPELPGLYLERRGTETRKILR